MTTDNSRPNFFLILGLDPAASWDQAAYQIALSEKRNQWSRQRMGIKGHSVTVEAQRNLALMQTLEAVMRDPEAREEERQAATRQAEAELRGKHDKFAQQVDLLLEKGYLWDVEYEKLRSEQAFLEADPALRQRIESAEKRPRQQGLKDSGRLDQAAERTLRDNLRVVGHPDLYAVLRTVAEGASETTPRDQLLAAADALYRKAQHTANKSLPEVGATQQLAGLARRVFGTDDLKRRHDASMRILPLDEILDRYEQALAAARAIDSRQFERFLREAAKKGVDVDAARDAFAAYFREKNWPVDMPSASAEARLRAEVRCPNCSHLNDPGHARCEQCGHALRDLCPGCGAGLPVAARACPQCGFSVAERAYASYLAELAEAAVEQGDLDDAAGIISRAAGLWPVPGSRSDELADRLRRVRDRLEGIRAGQRDAVDHIAALMDERRYRDALRQLRGLTFSHPRMAELTERCLEAVGESDRLCQQARAPGVPDERRAVLYYEALQRCADNADARRELSLIPPSPPRRLRAEADPERGVVRLTWDVPPGAGISSVVLRATGAVPPASPDGKQRVHVPGPGVWEDTAPAIGIPVSYAVYTQREVGGVMSRSAAVTDQPVFLSAEARLSARTGDGRVELAWALPDNATGIDIRRYELRRDGIAADTAVALPAPGPGATSYTDSNVRNGTGYRYVATVTFAYRGPGGQHAELRSSGTSCDVVPAPRPTVPGPVEAHGIPPHPRIPLYRHKVELRCPSPEAGVLRIVRTVPGRESLRTGDEFPEADLESKGLVLEAGLADIWVLDDDLLLCSYTPVLVLGGRCYVGEPRRYAGGPQVTGLRAESDGQSVRVTWSWPTGVSDALVAWSSFSEPFDPLTAPHFARATRIGSQATGRHDIQRAASRQLIVQVAAIMSVDGRDYITSGVTTKMTGGGGGTASSARRDPGPLPRQPHPDGRRGLGRRGGR